MISIEKLVQQIQQCKDTSIYLPSTNESIYVQKTAVEICDGDGDCKLLCDLLDLGGLCTVSIAVACIIHCW